MSWMMAQALAKKKKRMKSRRPRNIDGKIVLDGHKLKNIVMLTAGDFAVIRAPDNRLEREYIAKIEAVVRDRSSRQVQVLVTWLYRPETTMGGFGRLPYHGRDELFFSNHEDCLDVDTVERTCKVLTLHKYKKSTNVGSENDTYFARYFYDVESANIKPISQQRLHIHCLCMLPCNPDRQTISCDRCLNNFHPECVGLTGVNVKAIKEFLCPNCKCFLNHPHDGPQRLSSAVKKKKPKFTSTG
ncbi:protein MpHAT8 [Marchantia polymorpha subsp. ruderalis]|uniref:BAH domain-containing protein n=1 Tax=Marchantia polymorpha TaxID=3197 RepID=A0A2R6W207_MARPO|nr:hypothetical protein MARPO_0180s0005 [Marchantia polymorpha]BBN00762.1 hypothetical protein Mp_2g01890 [Marchantia polymorpha subsp. ruderalis]|eukprot:PTQ27880.1 hypothetical protein MARPO_0180s0005 [Marchantia polymorpha]